MKEDVSKYFTRQLRAFERNFRKSQKGFDMNAIHQMRLSVKRTKALFQFLEAVDAGYFNAKEEFRAMKNLFRLSGMIRDVQVQQELLTKTETILRLSFPGYLKYLRDKEEESISHFNSNLVDMANSGTVLNSEKINSAIARLSDEKKLHVKTIRLLNGKISEIDALRKDLSRDENVHKIRIILKQIHYIFDFSKQGFNYKIFLKMPVTRLKQIETVFGKWHDYVNAVAFIRDYMEQAGQEEAAACRPLLDKFEMEKESLFEQIKRILAVELLFHWVLEM
ncbi:MAG: CHAD domain-containing protein [Bacteroidales bacterium]|nr:CHAD domain-containing protein [Bacteroidales bacterium]